MDVRLCLCQRKVGDKVVLKDGVCEKVVCESWCVTKLCVKVGVCESCCVTKWCVKVGVCESWCVTKWCVTKLC